MREINTAVIGLGLRGKSNLKTIMSIDGVKITALCDVYEDRCVEGAKIVTEKGQPEPFTTTNYKDILNRDDVEAVMVFSSWETHIDIVCEAMRHGKTVGMEVGGAETVDECFKLVDTWEETRAPFMFLENCCFGKVEMMAKNMAEDGVFGEIVHCHGAYAHDLREEIIGGSENRHYRLNHYLSTNCDNYPTHDLGPIAKLLNINRGNRMVRLVSVASKAAGMKEYVKKKGEDLVNKDLIGAEFAQGDIVNTLITCENGETISLKLDTTLPRFYSREFTVRGTKGLYEQSTNSTFIEGDPEDGDVVHYKNMIDCATKYEDKYLPECWKSITKEIMELGHDGMDYLEFTHFFDCIANNKPFYIDVYDAASWMVVSALSKESIAKGNVPVEFPDFTRGEWKNR